jgi:hypothetical protein
MESETSSYDRLIAELKARLKIADTENRRTLLEARRLRAAIAALEAPPPLKTGSGGANAAIGAQNRKQIIDYLRDNPGANQTDTANALGLSRMMVSRHVRSLRKGNRA